MNNLSLLCRYHHTRTSCKKAGPAAPTVMAYRNGSHPGGSTATNDRTDRARPPPPRPTKPSPAATRRGVTGSSTDAKLLIDLSCEVGDIWQRSAIHSGD